MHTDARSTHLVFGSALALAAGATLLLGMRTGAAHKQE